MIRYPFQTSFQALFLAPLDMILLSDCSCCNCHTRHHHPAFGNDILLRVMENTKSLAALFKCALVHRAWTPLANQCMYQHLHLRSREDVAVFYKCLSAHLPDGGIKSTSFARTLHVELTDDGPLARRQYDYNKAAYHEIQSILPRLTRLSRMLIEAHVAMKWEEYGWMESWTCCMPQSLSVFMIRVRQLCQMRALFIQHNSNQS